MTQEIMETLQPNYILLDEMHRALAKQWSKGIKCLLEMYPNAKVLGLSATPIRYLDRCRNVVNELFSGNLACDMSLSQAILDGILPMARYVCGVYSYQKDAESLNKKIEKSYNSEEEKKELLKQVKILKENLNKGQGVSDIFRKYIVTGSEKFVVFLKNTTHLRMMKPVIEKWFTDAGFSVRLYEVHCKNADSDKEFLAFKEDTEDGIVKLCLSIAMVAEGIHGDIDGVIMLRETISPNFYFQMIGRAFSCGKKSIPLIFDLVANSQFISDVADNFPNELREEIEKRKKECAKEGKEYEVGFDIDEFIVMDEFMDVISGFKAIEGRLQGGWENGLKHFDKYVREHNGDVLVPERYKDEDGFCTGNWVNDRRSKFKNKQLSADKIAELDKRGFVWDANRYKFEKQVIEVKNFVLANGNYPKENLKNEYEKKLSSFVTTERKNKRNEKKNNVNYPQWKMDIIEREQLCDFFDEKESRFDKFYKMALSYREKYDHTNIKKGDVIDGYNINSAYRALIEDCKNGKISIEKIEKLKAIGIDITHSESKKRHDMIMQLARQAIKEGVIITCQNRFYQKVNFYNWYCVNKKKLSDKEREVFEQLVQNKSRNIQVKIVDILNHNYKEYASISEAARALHDEFHVENSDKSGRTAIHKRLTGKIKNPIYKNRFRFEYAENKVS